MSTLLTSPYSHAMKCTKSIRRASRDTGLSPATLVVSNSCGVSWSHLRWSHQWCDDAVCFYNTTASTWALTTPRSTWESLWYSHSPKHIEPTWNMNTIKARHIQIIKYSPNFGTMQLCRWTSNAPSAVRFTGDMAFEHDIKAVSCYLYFTILLESIHEERICSNYIECTRTRIDSGLLTSVLLSPKHLRGHLKKCWLLLSKTILIGSKNLANILFNFQDKITAYTPKPRSEMCLFYWWGLTVFFLSVDIIYIKYI